MHPILERKEAASASECTETTRPRDTSRAQSLHSHAWVSINADGLREELARAGSCMR